MMTMTPELKARYETGMALAAERTPAVDAKMTAMKLPELKAYAKTKGMSARGLTSRADFIGLVHRALTAQCLRDSGYTAASGYTVGQDVTF